MLKSGWLAWPSTLALTRAEEAAAGLGLTLQVRAAQEAETALALVWALEEAGDLVEEASGMTRARRQAPRQEVRSHGARFFSQLKKALRRLRQKRQGEAGSGLGAMWQEVREDSDSAVVTRREREGLKLGVLEHPTREARLEDSALGAAMRQARAAWTAQGSGEEQRAALRVEGLVSAEAMRLAKALPT